MIIGDRLTSLTAHSASIAAHSSASVDQGKVETAANAVRHASHAAHPATLARVLTSPAFDLNQAERNTLLQILARDDRDRPMVFGEDKFASLSPDEASANKRTIADALQTAYNDGALTSEDLRAIADAAGNLNTPDPAAQSALNLWARSASPLAPYPGPPPRVNEMKTDLALIEVQNAQQDLAEASASGNFRQIDEATTALMDAQETLKQAVKAEGGNSARARHEGDPAGQMAISAANLANSQDHLRAVEAQIPNLNDIPAQELESRLPPAQYQELMAARRDVGVKTDTLEQDVSAQALGMRAQGMTREGALNQLRAEGYGYVIGPPGSEKLQDGKIPNTLGMTENEKRDVYLPNFERNASPEARAAFDRGEPVVFAIRHDTPLSANGGLGEYDDRYVVMQKSPDGTVSVKEFDGCQDPNTQYGDGMRDQQFPDKVPDKLGPYADRYGSGMMTYVEAYSRVADGTIKMVTGPNGGHLYPENGDYTTQGDINGDGIWNDNYYRPAMNNGFQLHAGKEDYSHTGSGGCLTLPPHQWDEFTQAIGMLDGRPRQEIYYVQVGEAKMQY
jgi:hypothetical protein